MYNFLKLCIEIDKAVLIVYSISFVHFSMYNFHFRLSLSRQLIYYITVALLCQGFFENFFIFYFHAFTLSQDSLFILPLFPLFVNPFSTFFSFLGILYNLQYTLCTF